MQYLVVIEEKESGFGAYVSDLPGCIAAAASREEVLTLIEEAIEFHIEGLREHGLTSTAQLVEVGAAWRPPETNMGATHYNSHKVPGCHPSHSRT
jgi:predicted RNase H-like HicB family nuclease